jgi:hypothetical protein
MRAKASFEESLEQCLQELMRTGDLEASLERHSEHAEQLRPLLEVALETRRYYQVVPESPGGLATGRERLLAAAAQQREQSGGRPSAGEGVQAATRRGIKLALPVRLLAVLLAVVVGIAALTGGLVWAAQDSLPGELLYPVKLAMEEARLALASTPAGKVDVALGLMDERGEELQALAAAGRPLPEETVTRMERQVEQALTQTAEAGDEEIEGLLAQVAERTRTQSQRLEQAQAQAPEQAQAEFRRAVAVCRAGAEAAEAGLQDPQTFRWRYRHREGEPEPTREPEQEQEREREREREGEGTRVGTPSVTPQGPRGTSAPHATPKRLQGTAAATNTPQDPQATPSPQATATATREMPTAQGPRATHTPQATMQGPRATPTSRGPGMTATPQGPRPTAVPQATPQGPQPTAMPQATPQGPQSTAVPQATPQGSQPTAVPQATSQEPGGTPGHQGGTPGGG